MRCKRSKNDIKARKFVLAVRVVNRVEAASTTLVELVKPFTSGIEVVKVV